MTFRPNAALALSALAIGLGCTPIFAPLPLEEGYSVLSIPRPDLTAGMVFSGTDTSALVVAPSDARPSPPEKGFRIAWTRSIDVAITADFPGAVAARAKGAARCVVTLLDANQTTVDGASVLAMLARYSQSEFVDLAALEGGMFIATAISARTVDFAYQTEAGVQIDISNEETAIAGVSLTASDGGAMRYVGESQAIWAYKLRPIPPLESTRRTWDGNEKLPPNVIRAEARGYYIYTVSSGPKFVMVRSPSTGVLMSREVLSWAQAGLPRPVGAGQFASLNQQAAGDAVQALGLELPTRADFDDFLLDRAIRHSAAKFEWTSEATPPAAGIQPGDFYVRTNVPAGWDIGSPSSEAAVQTGAVRVVVPMSRRIMHVASMPLTEQYLRELARTNRIAPGMIVAWPLASDPTEPGWLECDGSAVDSRTWPDLAAVLNQNNGGSASLPDLRGLFLRGHDPAQLLDKEARTVGSVQDDAIQNHAHETKGHSHGYREANENGRGMGSSDPDLRSATAAQTTTAKEVVLNVSSLEGTSVRVGSETRPKNMAVRFFVYAGRQLH